MKTIAAALAGMGIIGVLLMLGFWVGALLLTIYGLYLAFSASILLGIVALLVEPSPLIFGLVMFFLGKNLPLMILAFLNK